MSDHTSTAREISEEVGCSIATVNNKASGLGIKLKGRSPEDHGRLMEAMKGVKPRKRKVKAKLPRPAKGTKKTRRKRKAGIDFRGDVDAYFSHGKALIKEIQKRLNELEKERTLLEEKLNALYLLHPDARDNK